MKYLSDQELSLVIDMIEYRKSHGILCVELLNSIEPMAQELLQRRKADGL